MRLSTVQFCGPILLEWQEALFEGSRDAILIVDGQETVRQLRALKYVEERGRITNREYRVLFPEVSQETVRLDLADMVSKGLLLRIGDKKGTFYMIK